MLFCPKPKVISIDSIPVPVDPDFRIMCDYSEAMSDKDADKACALFGEGCGGRYDGLLHFGSCARSEEQGDICHGVT